MMISSSLSTPLTMLTFSLSFKSWALMSNSAQLLYYWTKVSQNSTFKFFLSYHLLKASTWFALFDMGWGYVFLYYTPSFSFQSISGFLCSISIGNNIVGNVGCMGLHLTYCIKNTGCWFISLQYENICPLYQFSLGYFLVS